MALELKGACCASLAGDARLQRKAKLLETTLLLAMELLDMELEELFNIDIKKIAVLMV